MNTTDPKLYRELSKPFDTPEEANTALAKFMDEFYELRKKHRIADVAFVIGTNVAYGDEEGMAMIHGHFGDPTRQASLFAFGYGQAQAEDRAMLNKLVASKGHKMVSKQGTLFEP